MTEEPNKPDESQIIGEEFFKPIHEFLRLNVKMLTYCMSLSSEFVSHSRTLLYRRIFILLLLVLLAMILGQWLSTLFK